MPQVCITVGDVSFYNMPSNYAGGNVTITLADGTEVTEDPSNNSGTTGNSVSGPGTICYSDPHVEPLDDDTYTL